MSLLSIAIYLYHEEEEAIRDKKEDSKCSERK